MSNIKRCSYFKLKDLSGELDPGHFISCLYTACCYNPVIKYLIIKIQRENLLGKGFQVNLKGHRCVFSWPISPQYRCYFSYDIDYIVWL